MQVKTERGLINVERSYSSAEEAMKDGYSYSFTAKDLGDVYGKCLDDRGFRHTFVLIKGE